MEFDTGLDISGNQTHICPLGAEGAPGLARQGNEPTRGKKKSARRRLRSARACLPPR